MCFNINNPYIKALSRIKKRRAAGSGTRANYAPDFRHLQAHSGAQRRTASSGHEQELAVRRKAPEDVGACREIRAVS